MQSIINEFNLSYQNYHFEYLNQRLGLKKATQLIDLIYDLFFEGSFVKAKLLAINKLIHDFIESYGLIDNDIMNEKDILLIVEMFDHFLPKIRENLYYDMLAIYENDPACSNKAEVVLAYPGFYALFVYRVAHELALLKVNLLPRLLTEYAHFRTGIDIHPLATIGKSCSIDHGNGIVIGETCVIGDNVKIYQGVTLGALTTKGGQKLKGTKRHPTIKDNVTIYANATILGGETIIEDGEVVKANAFIFNQKGV